MGNRANVLVIDGESEVYLYTHWGRDTLEETVKSVLARRERWEDAPYLARMIFCAMVKGDIDGSTGFGISSVCGDGGDYIIIVNTYTRQIGLEGKVYTFEDFIHD